MSRLSIFADTNPSTPEWESRDQAAIALKFAAIGVRFEQWSAPFDLPATADDLTILTAYENDINRLKRLGGYQAVDVIRVLPDHPKRVELREKFLSEHTHKEDEVRFFVEGAGMFYLHMDDHVYMTLCERGDLIGVPDSVPHWFDLGASPCFTAIRFFTSMDGWIAHYTGAKLAEQFPKFEKEAA